MSRPAAPDLALARARLERLRRRPLRPGEASTFYLDPQFANAAVKVLPGEYFVDDDDVLITTTLGSCIAACLWDGQRRVGGMNHFMLAEAGTGGDARHGRYGPYAMQQLIETLLERGASRGALQAKVFGGGAVVDGMTQLNVGERNTRFVLDCLRAEGIRVVGQDVLDTCPRRVCFLPASGRALLRRLPASHAAPARGARLEEPRP